MDKLASDQRSALMRKVRHKDTKAELAVRSLVHRLGYRFRLHRSDLPGKPDLVFPSRKKAIFVHGCFWHGHDCRAGRNRPATNTPYWGPKLERNLARDKSNRVTCPIALTNVLQFPGLGEFLPSREYGVIRIVDILHEDGIIGTVRGGRSRDAGCQRIRCFGRSGWNRCR